MGQRVAALTYGARSELDLSIGRVEIPPRFALSDFHVHCSGWVLNDDDAACRRFEIRQPRLGLLRGSLRVRSSGEHTEIAFTDIAWAGARGRLLWRWNRGHWTLRCTLSGIDLSQLAHLHGRWITEAVGYTDIQGSADVRFELGGAGKDAARFQAVIGSLVSGQSDSTDRTPRRIWPRKWNCARPRGRGSVGSLQADSNFRAGSFISNPVLPWAELGLALRWRHRAYSSALTANGILPPASSMFSIWCWITRRPYGCARADRSGLSLRSPGMR